MGNLIGCDLLKSCDFTKMLELNEVEELDDSILVLPYGGVYCPNLPGCLGCISFSQGHGQGV